MDDTKDKNRTVHNLTLHTFTKGSSSTSAKQVNHFVIDKILNELVVGFFDVHLVSLTMLVTQKEVETTEIYHHGILQFQITLSERMI